MELIELYRERAALEGVRATVMARQLRVLRKRIDLLGGQTGWRDAEIARLRAVVEAQARELASLREQLAEARARSRQISVLKAVEAVLEAVERGSLRLTDSQLTRFAAELKAAFAVEGEEAGLVLGGPQVHAPNALSSLSFEVRPLPAPPGRTRAHRYLGNISSMELHDLANPTPNCQLGEIREERRTYFDNPEEAVEQGFDFCAYCFGREQSRR